MRRLLKFLHSLGAIGLMGAMACLLAIVGFAPTPASPAGEAAVLGAMARIATWVFMPSLGVTLVAGLLAIAVNPAYHEAGWVWVKAATGTLLFEGGLAYVMGPVQQAAKASAAALAGQLGPAAVQQLPTAERSILCILLAIALANVALGIWRPKLPRMPLF